MLTPVQMRNFAYGSNMCRGRMQERAPDAVFGTVAALPAHVLRFDKRSVDGSGKANALFTGDPADEVWGVVVDVPDDQREGLDRAEFLGSGYLDREVTVYDPTGTQLTAVAYIAEDSHVEPGLRPYDWYLRLVIEGARSHGLPLDYITDLTLIPADPDPAPKRPGRPPEGTVC